MAAGAADPQLHRQIVEVLAAEFEGIQRLAPTGIPRTPAAQHPHRPPTRRAGAVCPESVLCTPSYWGLPGQSRAEHQPREEQGFARVQTYPSGPAQGPASGAQPPNAQAGQPAGGERQTAQAETAARHLNGPRRKAWSWSLRGYSRPAVAWQCLHRREGPDRGRGEHDRTAHRACPQAPRADADRARWTRSRVQEPDRPGGVGP